MKVIGIAPDLIIYARGYLGRTLFTGSAKPFKNKGNALFLGKRAESIVDGALIEGPLFVIEDIEEDSPATTYKEITHIAVGLDLRAEDTLNLFRFTQFGDLLKFIENNMKPGRMFLGEFTEERKGLFEELKATHLGCGFSGYDSTHLRVRLNHRSPDADESHGLLKESLIVVTIGVEIGSKLAGHTLQIVDAEKIGIDGNNALFLYCLLDALHERGLAVTAGRVKLDVVKIQGMRGKFLDLSYSVAERFLGGYFL